MTKKEELSMLTGKEPIEGKQMAEVEPIEDTPFTLVGLPEDENSYFIALGKYRLTEPTTKTKALNELTRPYNLMVAIAAVTYENYRDNPPTNQ